VPYGLHRVLLDHTLGAINWVSAVVSPIEILSIAQLVEREIVVVISLVAVLNILAVAGSNPAGEMFFLFPRTVLPPSLLLLDHVTGSLGWDFCLAAVSRWLDRPTAAWPVLDRCKTMKLKATQSRWCSWLSRLLHTQ
jgi:hypothetical protein